MLSLSMFNKESLDPLKDCSHQHVFELLFVEIALTALRHSSHLLSLQDIGVICQHHQSTAVRAIDDDDGSVAARENDMDYDCETTGWRLNFHGDDDDDDDADADY